MVTMRIDNPVFLEVCLIPQDFRKIFQDYLQGVQVFIDIYITPLPIRWIWLVKSNDLKGFGGVGNLVSGFSYPSCRFSY
jgi:hypothetical protein